MSNGEYRSADLAQKNEHRITQLETTVAEIKRIVDSRTVAWISFTGSAFGGVVAAFVAWWLTKQ